MTSRQRISKKAEARVLQAIAQITRQPDLGASTIEELMKINGHDAFGLWLRMP